MRKPNNAALEAHMLFFNPAYMEMRPFDEIGPKHFPATPGVEIDGEGHAVFHYRAPHAKTVEVGDFGGTLSGKRFPMEKDENGIWSATVDQLPPGFHYHHYFVDGNCVTNPQAPYGYGGHEVTNFIEVPDPDGDFYLCRDVPHGSIHMEIYRSSKTGNMHNVWIYTPASYGEDPDRRYPVLYLHHGGGENETGWIWQGKINYILDNLIAEGKCSEMVVVMPCMYDVDYENPGDFLAGDYDHLLTADCMPLIERKYRVFSDGAHRAIAGLSMGSFHSLSVACNHPGMFGYIGLFSGSLDQRWYGWCNCRDVLENDASMRAGTKLLFLSVGTDEARIYNRIQENRAFLDRCGIPNAYYERPGYHDWTVWRYSVRQFLQQILL